LARAATERYVHRLILEQKARQARGQLEPDRRLHAISAPSPGKDALWILVNECALGVTSAAFFVSTGPGVVDYRPEEIETSALGTPEFLRRATSEALAHTHIPAVVRRYPNLNPKPEKMPTK
jgi:hypothetical protein